MTDDTTDRVAIRELIDAYAQRADRRDPRGQAALFAEDARVAVYQGEPGDDNDPVQTLRGQAELAAAFAGLATYEHTTHLNGQTTLTIDGDRATGETYCMAHHLWHEDGQRTLMVMALRYYDTFVREGDGWLFAERLLITDWVDRRPSEQ